MANKTREKLVGQEASEAFIKTNDGAMTQNQKRLKKLE
jgi:hypothetical protein